MLEIMEKHLNDERVHADVRIVQDGDLLLIEDRKTRHAAGIAYLKDGYCKVAWIAEIDITAYEWARLENHVYYAVRTIDTRLRQQRFTAGEEVDV